jgi:hypothetical protein
VRVDRSQNERRVGLTHLEEAALFSAKSHGVKLSDKGAESFLISSFVRSAIVIFFS